MEINQIQDLPQVEVEKKQIHNWKKTIKTLARTIIVAVLLVLTAVVYSYYPAQSIQGGVIKFNSPDETAAYFFAKQYAESGVLAVDEPLSVENSDHIHPRSITAVNHKLVPVTFLGMPVIYGSIGQIIGSNNIPFITPILASIALVFFYIFVSRIFDKKVGVISVVLLATHPAYWYNASRSMMPNVPFFALLIIGLSLLVLAQDRVKGDEGYYRLKIVTHYAIALLAGLFVGTALTIRFSEVVWVAGLLGLWGVFAIRRIKWFRLPLFFIGLVVPVLLFFSANNAIYGNILAGGYGLSSSAGFTDQFVATGNLVASGRWDMIVNTIKNLPSMASSYVGLLLPFGYRPKEFTKNFLDYGTGMFWWYVVPVCLGVLFALRNSIRSLIKKDLPLPLVYVVITGIVGCWLVMFYGSWVFYDNISQNVTLGNSYIRYWLPIYAASIPLIGYGVLLLSKRSGVVTRVLLITIIGSMAVYGAQITIWSNTESLVPILKNIDTYQDISKKVVALTPQDAIIVSTRSDKIFFPERKVAVSYDFRELELITSAMSTGRVYYYGLWAEKDGQYISEKYFEPLGFKMTYMEKIYGNEYLYHVEPL